MILPEKLPRISFAPMEGITTYIFRNAYAHHYKGIDTFYSPFLSNSGMSNKEKADVSPENNQGYTLIPQVLTNHPEVFLSLAGQLKELGYTEVNLNLGCPSGTVVAKNKGAGCLKDTATLEKLLYEIMEKSPVEVSLKTRIGIQSLEEWEDILKIYQKFPIKEMIIHPRLQKEFYTGTVHKEAYALAAQALSCPLCFNGDIVSVESFHAVMEQFPDTRHIMIGRGLLQNPVLAENLVATNSNNQPSKDIESLQASSKQLLAKDIDCLQASSEQQSPKDVKCLHTSSGQLPTKEIESLQASSEQLPAKDMKRFQSFHDELLASYIDYMSGDTPVLYKMKELWAYFSCYSPLSDKEKKQLRKCNSVRDYQLLMKNHFRY